MSIYQLATVLISGILLIIITALWVALKKKDKKSRIDKPFIIIVFLLLVIYCGYIAVANFNGSVKKLQREVAHLEAVIVVQVAEMVRIGTKMHKEHIHYYNEKPRWQDMGKNVLITY